MATKKKKETVKKLDLALQGGGSHGAYTWGVLDRLLEEPDIEFAAISGTSAGAMNGAVLVDGLIAGGREKAKEKLHCFWQRISEVAAIFSPIQQTPMEQFAQGFNLDWSVAFNAYDMLSRVLSPYEMNPMNVNPLRDVLEEMIDFECIRRAKGLGLFITATSVETGHPRVFDQSEIDVKVLLASACLPTMFQAVEIEGEPFWDGGYMGNPSLWPLVYHKASDDILLVKINPLYREGAPKHAVDIINRLNEISFNSSLIAEMRAINFVKKLIHSGQLQGMPYRNIHMHMVEAPEALLELTASSKVNTSWEFLQHLHQIGYDAATAWVKKHKSSVNVKSTLDIEATFLSNRYANAQKKKAQKK